MAETLSPCRVLAAKAASTRHGEKSWVDVPTPGRHSTRCRSCRLPRALMLNGFAVQEFRLVYNNRGVSLRIGFT